MMDSFTLKIDSLADLERKFVEMGKGPARRSLSKGLRQGANIITKDARVRARKKTGKLAKSIKTKNEGLRNGELKFTVSTNDNKSHLIEYGHKLVRGGKLGAGGYVIGWVPAFPFMRPAAENNARAAIQTILEVASAQIELEAEKLK